MGTWLGHAAPGTFFISYGLWWTIRTMMTYYKQPGQYKNSVSKPCCCSCSTCRKFNFEAAALILISITGVLAEIITAALNRGPFPMGNSQHCTMYVAFGLIGVVDLLRTYKVKFLPAGIEYMVCILALLVELVLFLFHLHGREPLDVHVHMLLVYTIGSTVVAVALEMKYQDSVKAAMARNYCFLVQGCWFVQIAFVLYSPWKDPNNPDTYYDLKEMENVMIVTLIYAWHLIGCFIATVLLSGLVYWCCSPRCQGDYEDMSLQMSLLESNKLSALELSDDEDSHLTASSHNHTLMNGQSNS